MQTPSSQEETVPEIMKTTVLAIAALSVSICLAAMTSFAVVENGAENRPDKEGHILSTLWKDYAEAVKADRPKEALSVLDEIISKARAGRMHYDFYDAAVRKARLEGSRNWKLRIQYEDWLDKEVAGYDEPVVSFRHKCGGNALAMTDFVIVNEARLRAGHNTAFYKDVPLDNLWTGMFQDDYEYALWTLALSGGSEKAVSLLREYLGGSYPKAAYLEYRQIAGKVVYHTDDELAERMSASEAFADKYRGKAVSLYAKACLLQDRFDSLSRKESGLSVATKTGGGLASALEQSYKSLYESCKSAELERLSYKSGVEKRIAGRIADFSLLMRSLERKGIDVSFEGNLALVTLRNLDKVSVELASLSKAAVPLLRKTVLNPKNSFYVRDTVKVMIPECDDGSYVFTVKNGKTEYKAAWNPVSLSIAFREDSEGTGLYVADSETGKPLDKVDLELFHSDSSVVRVTDVALSDDGFTPLPEPVASYVSKHVVSRLVASRVDADGFLRKTNGHSIYGRDLSVSDWNAEPASLCVVLSDKSAYNPGETLSFKAVLYKNGPDGVKRVFDSGVKVEAELINPDGKAAAKADLLTNEYGSVASSFVLPSDGKNGRFGIRVAGDGAVAYRYVTVDEFVLPSYDLSFDKDDRLHLVGDTVEVTGKVSGFSGHPLSAARVSYSVDKYMSRVSSGMLDLADDGSFALRFGTGDDDYPASYSVTVKVTDATGETRDFSRMVTVRNHFELRLEVVNAMEGSVSLSDNRWQGTPRIVSGDKAEVRFESGAGRGVGSGFPVEVEYSLKDSGGRIVACGKTLSGRVLEMDVPKSGLYRLEAEASVRKRNGKVVKAVLSSVIVRLDDSDTVLDADVENIFKLKAGCSDGELADGESIEVQFGTAGGPVWAVVELFGDRRQLLEHKIVRLDGKVGETGSLAGIVYDYKPYYPDAVRLNVFYFRNQSYRTFSHEFHRRKEKAELPLSVVSFTDKALPGTEYSLVLKSMPGVEAVASVFDKSSETIAANQWPLVRQEAVRAQIVPVAVSLGKNEDMVIAGYGKGKSSGLRGALYKRADMAPAANGIASAEMISEDASAESPAQSPAGVAEEESAGGGAPVRYDFSSTLAFEPFLRSDGDGNIFLKFKTSDKLSTFVAQVWAHTPQMRNAVIRREFLVTLPVKVSVAEPKYIYRGDRFTLHVTVSNGSEVPVSGVAALQAFPSKVYEGARPFESRSRKVSVPAGGSVEVAFDVDPKDFDELGLKVVFVDDAKTFSDGVFVSLPVLEAVQTLTEAHSAVLPAGADRAAIVSRLESEFTGTTSKGAEVKEIDVRRMLVDALPSKVEPAGKDVLSLAEALYVRRVAESLGSEVIAETPDNALLGRIKACANADGGFGWFEGFRSSPTVTAVLLERFAKMRDAGLDFGDIDLSAAVKWLDCNQFLYGATVPHWFDRLSVAQYAYVRSMYPLVKFDLEPQAKIDKNEYAASFKEFRKTLNDYLTPSAKDGRGLQGRILAKARRIKTLDNLISRDGGIGLAKAWGLQASAKMRQSVAADTRSLLEYAVAHPDGGWYYPNAVMPWRGLLESEAYAHSLLCDLLSDEYAGSAVLSTGSVAAQGKVKPAETGPSSQVTGNATGARIADGIRLWLMLQKETQNWDGGPAFADAIHSVLSGSEELLATKVLTLVKSYSVPFSKVAAAGNGFSVERRFYKEILGENGAKGRVEVVSGMRLNVGDKIIAEYKVWSQENRSFVRLTAPREAAFRPVEQLSGFYGGMSRPLSAAGVWTVAPQGYRDVKTDRTEFWFDVYPEDNSTVTEEFFVTQDGVFTAPVVTVESLYSPHYRANDGFSRLVETTPAER